MKKHILLFIILITGSISFSGNIHNNEGKESSKLVIGKVIDKKSGEEIVGAEVKIAGKTIYTDLNGNFSATINPSKTEVIIQSIAYNNLKINIDPFSYDVIIIELETK